MSSSRLEVELKRDFPGIMSDPDLDFSVSKGREALLRQTLPVIDIDQQTTGNPEVRVARIAEANGYYVAGLRISVSGDTSSETWDAVERAEAESLHACHRCGEEGQRARRGWQTSRKRSTVLTFYHSRRVRLISPFELWAWLVKRYCIEWRTCCVNFQPLALGTLFQANYGRPFKLKDKNAAVRPFTVLSPSMPNLNSTLGALLVGTSASSVLYGVSTMQAYIYYQHFPGDHWALKSFVAFIWITEGVHFGCMMNTLYSVLVVDDTTLLEEPLGNLREPRSTNALIFITITLAVSVHIFFTRRIWKL
uniref:Uncharacterized protein n=1 Tax=Mycena chlorophos TaxID=658473 RepID=A0ABQ0MDH9_MYCCL|nr:predicted protein [Mycena chlorophos]